MQKSRTPLALGWEAARANAVPALIIQAFMLALLVAYYTITRRRSALNLPNLAFTGSLCNRRVHYGWRPYPELFLIISFSVAARLYRRAQFAFYYQFGVRWNSCRSFMPEVKPPGLVTS
jgi:hypothetical protein